jgi:predicted house-cleaning noncanonical NTP pyrophosphatase (MazG superfamily)
MKGIEYNKLIRDRIPEIIEESGKKAVVNRIKGEELLRALNDKLKEELEEYIQSGSIEELADLVEVIYAILNFQGISVSEFNEMRENKNKYRGSFGEGLLLVEVTE